MNNALQSLKDANWRQANTSFDLVIRLAPNYAPAHMGKLCAELMVPEEKLLGDRVPPVIIDNNPLFKAALEHADPAYKRQIQGYADKLRSEVERLGRVVRQPGEPEAGERKVLTIYDVEYAFRWCPAGTFAMGSLTTEQGRSNNETQRQVTLSHGFWVLETEVTQLMWISVLGNDPSRFKGNNLPVESVSWDNCQEFIRRLNSLSVAPGGFLFSLPTEAQWEYACRAGTTTAYHFGDTLRQEQANFGEQQTKEVGSYPANAWGLRDMHGNVWEWCLDLSSSGFARVIKGGSWNSGALRCRSASRDNFAPYFSSNDRGFRLFLVRAE